MHSKILTAVGAGTIAIAMNMVEASALEHSKGTVNTDVLNVRSGPGTNNNKIGTTKRGDKLDILESSNGWHRVKLPNGQEGWVSGNYVTIDKANNSSNESTITNSISKGKVTASVLNVRSGVGTQHSVVGKLNKDTTISLLEKFEGWYKVKLSNGIEGWISGAYVQVVELDACKPPVMDNNSADSMSVSKKQEAILSVAKAQLNKPYVWGAEGPNSFDCSGFTKYVYKKALNINIPRVSGDQARFGEKISVGNFQIGDLIYLDTSGALDGVVSHVGIYIGNGEMIHASGSKSNPKYVTVSKIDSGWYKDRVLGARRLM